jgi:hypothetical protein
MLVSESSLKKKTKTSENQKGKNVKKLSSVASLLCLLVISIFSPSALGSVPLPVGSEDQLREYALGQVVRGYRGVGAQSLVTIDNKPTWVEATGGSAEEVLDKLFSQEIVFGLSNPNDKVTGNLWLYNRDGRALFYGRTDYTVVDLKEGPPSYNIWMQKIPLLERVSAARLLALNLDGVTTHTEFLEVENGHIQFPSYLAGVDNGILVVYFDDQTEAVYNLWGVEGHAPSVTTEKSASWQIQSHYVVAGNDTTKIVVKFIETMSSPTVLLEDVRAGQTVVFDCLALTYGDNGQYFERPSEVIITKTDGSMSSAPIFTDGQTSLQLEPGSYRLRFTWPTFQKNRQIWYGPDGEGKG